MEIEGGLIILRHNLYNFKMSPYGYFRKSIKFGPGIFF